MPTPLFLGDIVHPWDCKAALVLVGSRTFMVIGMPDDIGSIILEWKDRVGIRPAAWVSRGVSMAIDPQVAVTGFLLGPGALVPDAIEIIDLELRRMHRAAGAKLGSKARVIRATLARNLRKDAATSRRRIKR